jgi:hypothetical protein
MHTGHVENEETKLETNEHLNSVPVRTSRDGKRPPLMMWIPCSEFSSVFFQNGGLAPASASIRIFFSGRRLTQ